MDILQGEVKQLQALTIKWRVGKQVGGWGSSITNRRALGGLIIQKLRGGSDFILRQKPVLSTISLELSLACLFCSLVVRKGLYIYFRTKAKTILPSITHHINVTFSGAHAVLTRISLLRWRESCMAPSWAGLILSSNK